MPRHREPEVMDDPGLDPADHRHALVGLARINRWSATAERLAREIRSLRGHQPTRVLDLACGGGDVARSLARIAAKNHLPWTVHGSDASHRAVEIAEDNPANADLGVRFFPLDAVTGDYPEGYDFIVNSLFLHHLDADDAIAVLRRMAGAATHIVISDLVRSRAALAFTHLGVRTLSRCRVVHADGPQSVHGAWTRAEAIDLAERAGLDDAKVRRSFPMRWMLTWFRSSTGEASP